MNPNYEVAIIGAGFAGIGAGIRLTMEKNDSFIIFERAAEVGGTWRENTYPGCACDIPSLLYSYSFAPNPTWSRSFSRQAEILEYLKDCVKKYNLEQHIRYNTDIRGIKFDEQKGYWTITDKQGNQTTAKVVISAAGPFNAPLIPNIKGRDKFKGKAFHSLEWDQDYDLKGKRVAVIGTGASAIQFIPEIAPDVEQLHVFQRTAPWVTPKPDKEFTEIAHKRFKNIPFYQRFWRELIYWFLENRGRAQYSDNSMRATRKQESLDHLNNSVNDKELRKKLTPNYEFGCKRVLISDDYYPALQRENVTLINEGATEIYEDGIIDQKGNKIEVDAIIYGTGFYTTEFKDVFEVIGLKDRNLFKEWNDRGSEAYYGVTVNGFPNLLYIVGPNSGLGYNSIIHMMESQLNYILDYLKKLKKVSKPSAYFDLKLDIQAAFNEKIQKELSTMIWSSGGCESYYLLNGGGKNTSIWPGSTVSYRKQTKRINIKDYNIL